MTTPPQGKITFSAINPDSVIQASFTLTHGISPSVATLVCAPGGVAPIADGTLFFEYGSISWSLPNCRMDKVSKEYAADGSERWVVPIFDRRWRWKKQGRISGRYNIRRNKYEIVAGTEKKPRELAKLCLDALGEQNPNVSKMPDELRPEVDWDYDNPADALAKLADECGCRIVYKLNNTIWIEPAGQGASLPTGGDVISAGISLDPPEIPDKVVIVTHPTKWQFDFELEAVGLEADGKIKLVDDLTYKPTDGWENEPVPDFPNVDAASRKVAKESVWRWYRIKVPFKLPMIKDDIESLDRILPIYDHQIEKQEITDSKGAKREDPRPAWVYGKYTPENESHELNTDTIDADLENKPEGFYDGTLTLDTDLGIVKFAEPVYSIEEDTASSLPSGQNMVRKPADIRLRVAVSLRDKDTRGWIRYEKDRATVGKSGGQPEYEIRDDLIPEIYNDAQGNLKDNKPDIDKAANYYLDAIFAEYQIQNPGTFAYAGFKKIDLDGAINSGTWQIDAQGAATCSFSRNDDSEVNAPSYKERRMLESLQSRSKEGGKIAKTRAENQRRGKA